jgi:hypothetical protein
MGELVEANVTGALLTLVALLPTAVNGSDDVGVAVVNGVPEMRYEKFALAERVKFAVPCPTFILNTLEDGACVSSVKAPLVALEVLFAMALSLRVTRISAFAVDVEPTSAFVFHIIVEVGEYVEDAIGMFDVAFDVIKLCIVNHVVPPFSEY